MLTISPVSAASNNIKRNVLINAFDVQTTAIDTDQKPIVDIAVAPISGFYGCITDTVTIRDSMTDSVIAEIQGLTRHNV